MPDSSPSTVSKPERRVRLDPGTALLPFVGCLAVLALWAIASASIVPSLPSPLKTWQVSRPYIVAPFEKRGELDQGILRFTWYSLIRVAKGYSLAIVFGT